MWVLRGDFKWRRSDWYVSLPKCRILMLNVCCLFCVSLLKIQPAMPHVCGLSCAYTNSKYCHSVCQRVNKPRTALSMSSYAQRICSKTPPNLAYAHAMKISPLFLAYISILFLCFHIYSCWVHNFSTALLWGSVQKLLTMETYHFSVAQLIHARSCLWLHSVRETMSIRRMDAYVGFEIKSQTCHVFCLLAFPKSFEHSTMALSRLVWSQWNSICIQ